MKVLRIEHHFRFPITVFFVFATFFASAVAQSGHNHSSTRNQQLTQAQGALLQAVRDSTARFKDVSVAESEGYSLLFGCVTGPDSGAMGLHYVNLALVAGGEVDATKPQIVIYEPKADGH